MVDIHYFLPSLKQEHRKNDGIIISEQVPPRKVNVDIIDPGKDYTDKKIISLWPFSDLINSDSSVYNKWAIYRLNDFSELSGILNNYEWCSERWWNQPNDAAIFMMLSQ